MTKAIAKEMIIVVILLVFISLLLAVILYDYMPINKVVPAKVVAYDISEDIKNELKDVNIGNTDNIIKTYTVEADDLNVYEKSKKYDKGKENPFAISDKKASNPSTSINNDNKITNASSLNSSAKTGQGSTTTEYTGK